MVWFCSGLLEAQSQAKVDPAHAQSSYAALLLLHGAATELFDRFCSAATI